MSTTSKFPPQQLSFTRKNKEWRKKCVDWADGLVKENIYSNNRKSLRHRKINYDLFNGILHQKDIVDYISPHGISGDFIPKKMQHYPIINAKLEILIGEESKRPFDYKVVVTNPNSISEIENNKKEALFQELQQLVQDQSSSDEEYQQKLDKLSYHFMYEWQDLREIRANSLINHYSVEQNFKEQFRQGLYHALIGGEEIYFCDIVHNEPYLRVLNPLQVHYKTSGTSNKIEDAEMIVIEDYFTPSQIVDMFYDSLTEKDRKYIEDFNTSDNDSYNDGRMGSIDERPGMRFVPGGAFNDPTIDDTDAIDVQHIFAMADDEFHNGEPVDSQGNIRVLRVFWKSRRKVKDVKSYDPQTGEEIHNLYPETYQINKELGEEEKIYWINEAWEGTKIGDKVYVNIRPRPVQYNRLTNPSLCHFGIIGTIYQRGIGKPYSLVDMMKNYNYEYDIVHARLNDLLSKNWGKILKLDTSQIPDKWTMDKWLYYAKNLGLAVVNSLEEGKEGIATNRIAGTINNSPIAAVDLELGNSIQMCIELLEFIKNELSEVTGITKQREGQIASRETVGGVERSVLQSSATTEWIFSNHDNTKRRVMDCFIETAKIAMMGSNLKFQYLLDDATQHIMDIPGDEFSENDYGVVIDNSNNIEELNQKLDILAQAALQNQTLSFSTIMKIYTSQSNAEKIRIIERDEQQRQQQAQQQQQQEMEMQQQQLQAQAEAEQKKLELDKQINDDNNNTKLQVELLKLTNNSVDDGVDELEHKTKEHEEKKREFDEKLKLERDRLAFDKDKAEKDRALKKELGKRKTVTK